MEENILYSPARMRKCRSLNSQIMLGDGANGVVERVTASVHGINIHGDRDVV
jgi:hypothetical protein